MYDKSTDYCASNDCLTTNTAKTTVERELGDDSNLGKLLIEQLLLLLSLH